MSKKNKELEISAGNSTVKIDDNKINETNIKQILGPEVLQDNQIFIKDYGVITINPTRLKYFFSLGKNKSSMYNGALLIQQMGYNNVLVYNDGKEVVENALKAILDIEEVDFLNKLTTEDLNKIIKIGNKVNEVKIDDFLTNQKMEKEGSQKKENV